MNDAIISIRPVFVEKLIDGFKTVELRTREINLPVGSRLWIYTTLPVGKIEIYAEIDFVFTGCPSYVWSKYGNEICISKEEFDAYVGDRVVVSAVGLKNITALDVGVSLKILRDFDSGFNPPQFYSMLKKDSNIYPFLMRFCGLT